MIKGFVLELMSKAVFVISAYAMHILLARMLGPDTYGSFATAMAVLMVAYVFTNNGFRQVVSRHTARLPQQAASWLRYAFRGQLLVALMLAGALTASARPLAALFDDPQLAPALVILAPAVFFQALLMVYCGTLNGLKRFGRVSALKTFQAVLRAAFPVAAVFIWPGRALAAAAASLVPANIIPVIGGFFFTRRLPEVAERRGLAPPRFPLLIIPAFGLLTMQRYTDIFWVKAVAPSAAAGHYIAAANLGKIMFMAMSALAIIAFPYFAQAADDRSGARLLAVLLRVAWSALFPLMIILSFLRDPLVNIIYGRTYAAAADCLPGLLLGLLAVGSFFFIAQYLIARDRSVTLLAGGGALLLITIAAVAYGTDVGGIVGASRGMAAAGAVSLISMLAYIALRYHHGLLRSVIWFALSATLPLAVTASIPYTSAILLLPLSLGVFVLTGFLLGQFSLRDIRDVMVFFREE